MSLNSVDAQIKAGRLLDFYKSKFEARFSQPPILDVGASMETTRWLVNNVGYERARDLIAGYFTLSDDWILGQGYSLEYLKNNLNKVIARTTSGHLSEANKTRYVIATSESGADVVSTNPNEMGRGTHQKPVLAEEGPQERPYITPRPEYIARCKALLIRKQKGQISLADFHTECDKLDAEAIF